MVCASSFVDAVAVWGNRLQTDQGEESGQTLHGPNSALRRLHVTKLNGEYRGQTKQLESCRKHPINSNNINSVYAINSMIV